MDKVSIEFYKNVSLLTKFVAPHDDFKKHFKEGMFDKPNTSGFIHVSYYLLNVYYKDKSKVQWPVICKQTENKFRNDVRESLMTISSENEDINFPPIFASHLLLARGTKFLLIMWKFSLVVLRTYLKNKYHCTLMNNPKSGPCLDLTKDFLISIIKDNYKVVFDIREKKENLQKEAIYFLKEQSEIQNLLKTKILNIREGLKQVINDAPVNATGKESLSNVEVDKIINMWIIFINNTLKPLEIEVKSLIDDYKLLKSIISIVSVIKGDVTVLNAKNLDPINVDPMYQLVPPEMQVLPYSLYNREALNLKNFFTLYAFLLQKFKASHEKNNIDKFSMCKIQLETSNKDLKTAINQFHSVLEEINNCHLSNVKKVDAFNDTYKIISNVLEFDKVLFMSSPSIHISSAEGGSNFNHHDLQLTPVEGVHKELFSRHISSHESALTAKKPIHVQRINFDDSTTFELPKLDHSTTIDKQSLFRNRSSLKNADKYSKIFSSRSRKHDNKADKSIMNMMLPLLARQQNISLADSCNSSQEISQNSFLMNPNLSSVHESSLKAEEKETQNSQKRRSISDLVERYKRILQERESK
ncbi:HAUS augmin-like complex subunit 6 [Phymastichus coffea]|uniref:HAUS augmin-like complex subunit 6 n=1 Tax=Phymastichus coffea TaxID=108790 RepID=UPI00273AB4C7|nr:HAUS augmin-like complex subunit 6 [Phymastichus coffea]